MKLLLILLPITLFSGCASVPLTEEEIFQREYEENDRKLQYKRWEKACHDADMIIYADKPSRVCRRKGCIPHKWDWRWDDEHERPKIGNSYTCVSRRQMQEALRELF